MFLRERERERERTLRKIYGELQFNVSQLIIRGHLSYGRGKPRKTSARRPQRLRGVRGQDDATETGRRATPQTIVDLVRNRTLK